MARNARGQTLMSPKFRPVDGHITFLGDLLDEVYERQKQGLEIADLAIRHSVQDEAGYIAPQETEEVKRPKED